MLPEEVEAIRSEEDALKAYEDPVKETKAPIEAEVQEMINKTGEETNDKADPAESSETITFVLRRGGRVIKRHVMKRRRC